MLRICSVCMPSTNALLIMFMFINILTLSFFVLLLNVSRIQGESIMIVTFLAQTFSRQSLPVPSIEQYLT